MIPGADKEALTLFGGLPQLAPRGSLDLKSLDNERGNRTAVRNIVLVTLDCVRPDHLGCYGYRGVETPHLDQLAACGLLFEEAVTHGPNTWVAHGALFTGCYPPVNGLRSPHDRLSPQVVTMAEWFSAHGWTTAAFPGTSLVGRGHGFHRGFDLFDDKWLEAMETSGGKVLWRRNWKQALAKAFEWMEESREPFLVWLHYIDTHHLPILDLPEYYRSRFSPRWQYYDGKVSRADTECVGEIKRFLEDKGFSERTVLAIFADHGEELGEDGRPLHDGELKEDVVRVPLIMVAPGTWAWGGKRLCHPVGLVDVFPTLCKLTGLEPPSGIQGLSLDEEDLLWGSRLRARILYLENWPKGFVAARTSQWKLVLRVDPCDEASVRGPKVAGLYDLRNDPGGTNDLSGSYPDVVEWLRAECMRWFTMSPSGGSWEEGMESVKEALEALGYI
jgi:arylsulfatase A-like enzyme